MSEVRVVDLKELGVSKEVFDKIYSMGEQDGRADMIFEVSQGINNIIYEYGTNGKIMHSLITRYIHDKYEWLKEQN